MRAINMKPFAPPAPAALTLLQDEVLILGGGVAGCAAAIALARKGRSVRLIERELTSQP